MINNLKALGLALVATLGMTALATSPASAALFHSEGENTTLSGSQTTLNVLTFDSGEIECENAEFESGVIGPKTVESVAMTPSYNGCTAFGLEADIRTNDCTFVLHSGGSMDIECPNGQEIEYDASGLCIVRFPGQEGLSSVSYTNEASGSVVVSANVSGIAYEEEGFFCVSSGEVTENGTYTGGITVTGDKGGIWVK